jgi:two-component system, chemotaxis family, chemotaxis protein CheY
MSLRVMVVDDALFMRNMLRGILVEGGHEVIAEAANGEEAVEKYRICRPDVVTMDIVMPKKSGIEALEEIKSLDPQARVVMCSAMGQEALVSEARAAGALDFILKPFNPQRVLEVVRNAAEL